MAQEAVVMEAKTPPAAVQRPARRRPAERESQTEPAVRFFLAGKESQGGTPALGREVANENEALIDSLKTGVSFYAVAEYHSVPDLTGKVPTIRKEPVKRQL
jgi:hypothetical protein